MSLQSGSKDRPSADAEAAVPVHGIQLKKDVISQRRWINYLWDTLDKSPEERRFLFKLDAALLTFASLGMSQWC